MGKTDPFAALRLVSFRRYVVGRMMLSLGLQVQSVAVGWQLYERTGLAEALGYIGLAQVLPVFSFSLSAGQLADRINRRTIILVAAAAQVFVAAALLGIAWADAPVEWAYAALFVSGTARAFYYTANSAIVPQITGAALFPNAVTWNVNAFYAASAAGPAIAGGLIALTGGAAAAYALNLAGALGCVLTMLGVARPPDPRPEPGAAEEKGWRNVAAGARYVWRTPMILAPITLDMFAVILGGATALMPIYAKDILQVGPAGLGWLRAAPALGGVAMAFWLASRPPLRRAGPTLLVSVALFGACTVAFGLSRSFPFSLAMLVLLGAADMVSVVIRHTLIQVLTPDAMRGRVSAVNGMFIASSNELGAFESGMTAKWLGPVASVAGGGTGTLLVVALVAWLAPALRTFGALPTEEPRRPAEPTLDVEAEERAEGV